MKAISKTKSTTLKQIGSVFCSIFFIFLHQDLRSQCAGGDQFPTLECQDAPLICLQNWCYESTNEILVGYSGFCGPNTIVNNPQYYAFIADADIVEIDIHVDYCNGGSGIQSAILGNCPWEVADVLACNPGSGPGTIMVLIASDLIIGQQYWLLLDGSNGAFCSYTITSVSGIFMPDLSGEIDEITTSEDSVFQGHRELFLEASPSVNDAHGYYWVLGWSGDTVISPHPFVYIDIPCDVDPGIFSICVRAFTGCDTMDSEVCTFIEIFDQPDTIIKPPSTFCPEEFPFFWDDLKIDFPGIYTQTFNIPFECPVDTIWEILSYPETGVGQIDTNVCGQEFYYEGTSFDASGMYELVYPGQGANGCDSSAELHLTLHYPLGFFVESVCEDSQFLLRPIVILHVSGNDTISYAWFDCNFTEQLSTSETYNPDTSGCYCLVATHSFCNDTICSTYEPSACDVVCNLVEEQVCTGQPVLFTYDGAIPSGAKLHWLIDLPGESQTYFSGSDSLLLQYNTAGCYHVSLTIVDDTTTHTCVDSFCVVDATSTASICCDTLACDTCTTITIELAGISPWTIYISDGTSIDTIAGVTDSTYLYVACPPLDTTISYTILVADSIGVCPAIITGEAKVDISLYSTPEVSIIQTADTLCASLAGLNSYNWFNCIPESNFSTTQCLIPPSSGCYCVEVTSASGCVDTACYDFIISGISPIQTNLMNISPIPSKGNWDVRFAPEVALPVEWVLVDLWGEKVELGIIENQNGNIHLPRVLPSGLYILKFVSAARQCMTAKVILQTE